MPLKIINYKPKEFEKVISKIERDLLIFLFLDISLLFLESIIFVMACAQNNTMPAVLSTTCLFVTLLVGKTHLKKLVAFYCSSARRFHFAVCDKTIVSITLSNPKKGEVSITVRDAVDKVEVTSINFSVAYVKAIEGPVLDMEMGMIFLPLKQN